MGAAGVQLGTKFVMTEECPTHQNLKEAFIKARARQAISTPQYDSKLPVVAVRAIKNQGMEDFGKLQFELLKKLQNNEITREKAQYDVESYWAGRLRDAVVDGNVDKGSLMAGQSVGLVDKIVPMKDMLAELVADAEAELQRVNKVF